MWIFNKMNIYHFYCIIKMRCKIYVFVIYRNNKLKYMYDESNVLLFDYHDHKGAKMI